MVPRIYKIRAWQCSIELTCIRQYIPPPIIEIFNSPLVVSLRYILDFCQKMLKFFVYTALVYSIMHLTGIFGISWFITKQNVFMPSLLVSHNLSSLCFLIQSTIAKHRNWWKLLSILFVSLGWIIIYWFAYWKMSSQISSLMDSSTFGRV